MCWRLPGAATTHRIDCAVSNRFPLPFFPGLVLAVLSAYLLGSIPSGVIVARAFANVDVRQVGSGHTGTVNTVRAAGFKAGVLAFLADTGKAVVAIEWARLVTGNEWGMALAGFAAVVGHCYPLYTHWHGGMGLATGGAALFVLDAPILFLLVLLWFPLKYLVKHSSRASMGIALLLPLCLIVTRADLPLIVFGVGVGALIFYRHLGDWNR